MQPPPSTRHSPSPPTRTMTNTTTTPRPIALASLLASDGEQEDGDPHPRPPRSPVIHRGHRHRAGTKRKHPTSAASLQSVLATPTSSDSSPDDADGSSTEEEYISREHKNPDGGAVDQDHESRKPAPSERYPSSASARDSSPASRTRVKTEDNVVEPSITGRRYRGRCLYQSRKCENERALKRNGQAHNLCEEHRAKQNQHQRKFDAKKFTRRCHRYGPSPKGDHDEDADQDHDELRASPATATATQPAAATSTLPTAAASSEGPQPSPFPPPPLATISTTAPTRRRSPPPRALPISAAGGVDSSQQLSQLSRRTRSAWLARLPEQMAAMAAAAQHLSSSSGPSHGPPAAMPPTTTAPTASHSLGMPPPRHGRPPMSVAMPLPTRDYSGRSPRGTLVLQHAFRPPPVDVHPTRTTRTLHSSQRQHQQHQQHQQQLPPQYHHQLRHQQQQQHISAHEPTVRLEHPHAPSYVSPRTSTAMELLDLSGRWTAPGMTAGQSQPVPTPTAATRRAVYPLGTAPEAWYDTAGIARISPVGVPSSTSQFPGYVPAHPAGSRSSQPPPPLERPAVQPLPSLRQLPGLRTAASSVQGPPGVIQQQAGINGMNARPENHHPPTIQQSASPPIATSGAGSMVLPPLPQLLHAPRHALAPPPPPPRDPTRENQSPY